MSRTRKPPDSSDRKRRGLTRNTNHLGSCESVNYGSIHPPNQYHSTQCNNTNYLFDECDQHSLGGYQVILLSQLISMYEHDLLNRYKDKLLPSHYKAIDAMKNCRTEGSLLMLAQCEQCEHQRFYPHSCGHRHCPHCQHHGSSRPSLVFTAFRLLSIRASNGSNDNAANYYPSTIS